MGSGSVVTSHMKAEAGAVGWLSVLCVGCLCDGGSHRVGESWCQSGWMGGLSGEADDVTLFTGFQLSKPFDT